MSAPDNIGRKGTPGGATGIPALTSESQAPLCDEFGRLIVVIDGIVASEGGSGGGSGAILSDAIPAILTAVDGVPGVGLAASRDDHRHAVGTGTPVGLSLTTPNAAGSSNALARADHTHAITGVLADVPPTAIAVLPQSAGDDPTASRSDHAHAVVTATAVGLSLSSSNAEGVSAALARADHTHAISGVLSGSAPVQVNAGAAAVGVATSASHADHKHSVQVAPPIDLTLATVNAEGTSVALARADHAHAITDVLAANPPTTLQAADAATVGAGLLAARSDHKHGVPVTAPIALVVGGANAAGTAVELVRADHKHALPAFGTGPGTFCEGNDARLSALGSMATPSGNPYIDPPLVADAFDDEFSSGSADLAVRGYTVKNNAGVTLTRSGDIDPFHATGPTSPNYWSTIIGSFLFLQFPTGAVCFVYKAITLSAGDTYYARLGHSGRTDINFNSNLTCGLYAGATQPDLNNRVYVEVTGAAAGSFQINCARATSGSNVSIGKNPAAAKIGDIRGIKFLSGTSYMPFTCDSANGDTLSPVAAGAPAANLLVNFVLEIDPGTGQSGSMPLICQIDFIRKKTGNAWIASAPRPVAWNTVDANFANYTPKAAPVGADSLVINDSAASDAVKRVTVASLLSAVVAGVNGFRLSTSASSPIPGNGTFSTIYLAPYNGISIGLYSGGAWQLYQAPAGASLALSGMTAGIPRDIFAYASGTTVLLESVAWTGANTRTALATQDGVAVKAGDPTRRYIGTILPNSATQIVWQELAIDSTGTISIWNAYNRINHTAVWYSSTQWTPTGSTYQPWANNAAHAIDVVIGQVIDSVSAVAVASIDTKSTYASINGIPTPTPPAGYRFQGDMFCPTTQRLLSDSHFAGKPSLGANRYSVQTYSVGGTAAIFYSANMYVTALC